MGDLVPVKISFIVTMFTGSSLKLILLKIIGLDNDRYDVTNIAGSQRSQIPCRGVYAVEHINRWISFTENYRGNVCAAKNVSVHVHVVEIRLCVWLYHPNNVSD